MKRKGIGELGNQILFVSLIIIALIVITTLGFMYRIELIEQELSQLPHKVCWNETTILESYEPQWVSYMDKIGICQDNECKEVIWITCVNQNFSDCSFERVKEVCKWEGLE